MHNIINFSNSSPDLQVEKWHCLSGELFIRTQPVVFFFFFNSLSKIIILKKSPLIKSKIRSNHLEKIHTQKDYISILGLGLRVTCSLAGFFMRGQTVTTN